MKFKHKQILKIMKTIKNEKGYLLYTVTDTEITLDNIKVYEQRKGNGRKMINELKDFAIELQLPIGLYSYPQDDTLRHLMPKLQGYKIAFLN